MKDLFDAAESIISFAVQKSNNPDFIEQYNILKNRSCSRLTEEHDILNNFLLQGTSYSALRKSMNVYYAMDFHNFDLKYGTNFFTPNKTPKYNYRQWQNITVTWGNVLLFEIGRTRAKNFDDLLVKLNNFKIILKPRMHRPRVVWMLATGLPVIKTNILKNPQQFLSDFDTLSKEHPGQALKEVNRLAKPIEQVGPPLMSNVLKEMGLLYLVKPDVHLTHLLNLLSGKNVKGKDAFNLAWLISKEIGLEPFFLDKIMYIGGRFVGLEINKLFEENAPRYKKNMEYLLNQIKIYK